MPNEEHLQFSDNTCLIRSLESMLTDLTGHAFTLSPDAKAARKKILDQIHAANKAGDGRDEMSSSSVLELDQEIIPELIERFRSSDSPDKDLAKILQDCEIEFVKGTEEDVVEYLKQGYEVAFVTVRPSEKKKRLVPHIFHVALNEDGQLENLSDILPYEDPEHFRMQMDADFQFGEFISSQLDWNILLIRR